MPLTGREKATILLSILGEEASARILRYLPGELADLIAAGVNHLPTPTPEALAAVLGDFNRFVSLPSEVLGREAIEAGEMEELEVASKEKILRTSGRTLAAALVRERPQTIAFILSRFLPAKISDVLSSLPEGRRDVEILLNELKPIPFSEKLESMVFETLSKKLSL